ncbi:MAG TPA: bifunctional diaminohydroxyphosphoribosylaminopyrimidine deaminase/5-amino-6-(5-phosphoribosylamino)uracil reductase RibD [Thermoanaerobaculia bacterium]|jgi:diaminohydroxyphosphoribosylaminopyrimidine deaminase/5-amino-6-(5-phosphoribosylamino)uracil reductase|nr:bifunctional diaminohydroxyphosphoribosylaminopyrimidine deaminase/5-amino-6-(5-phosphoribosylamino)uracil reductase RibD [Thermoanaerobaculia bacterium]
MAAPVTDRELDALRLAQRLAERGRFRTSPNPMVGAVLLRGGDGEQSEPLAVGWHREVGGPHAEVEALRQVDDARGSTLCVTLEPCAHHGRTPPCADAVIAAGVRRVVACHRDPDPRVAGEGFARLAAAGIEVTSGHLVDEAVRLNWKYLTAKLRGRPGVTLKWAMSLDGKIAARSGDSRWITSEPARRWSLELREVHDAILVGSGTALADDPLLTRRLGRARGPILRVVLDRRLRLPATARMLGEPGPVLVYAAMAIATPESIDALRERGAEVVVLPAVGPAAVLADLAARGVHSVLVEGGGEMLAAFAAAGAFDRVEVACAPLLVGGRDAPGPLGGAGAERLADALRLDTLEVRRRGPDVLLGAFRNGCLPDLSASVAG